MSDNWVITPPCSPQLSKTENASNCNDLDRDNGNAALFLDDWSYRMFCCMGEPQNSVVTFHDESYLMNNDLGIFCAEDSQFVILVDDFGPIDLFGFKFDKGSALIKDSDLLFKMAKCSFLQLDCAARINVNSLGTNLVTKKPKSLSKQREELVKFLIYVRNFIQRVGFSSKYCKVAEGLYDRLHNELTKLRLICGSVDNIPDYIINYSACNSGNQSTQPSYHLFHCQLDVKWLHITLLYQLIIFKQKLQPEKFSEEFETSLNFRTMDTHVEHLLSDLITIALKRFQQVSMDDLLFKSFFACTCIQEIWKLLQLSICRLHIRGHIPHFWDFVNRICSKIVNSTVKSETYDCSLLITPKVYTCSYPYLFSVWMLKHLVKLWNINEKMETKSNYFLLENAVKMCINSEPSEFNLRIFLCFVENILNSDWEMKTDPLALLWDYFNKKLNSLFYIPSSNIDGLAVIRKSSSALLAQLNSELDQSLPEKNSDSFHLFLRLLGRNLRKWQDNPKFWNQLKGRIFSKFSAAKLLSLNEIGLYHFISLFLTLAITTDLREVSKKLQHFLSLLIFQELDEARMKLVWKAHIGLILLFAENNQEISSVSSPILNMVDKVVQQPDHLSLMRIFSDGFQDLVDSTNNLELGQYTLIGNWISIYLSRSNESDVNRFLETVLSLVNKLNSLLSAQLPVSQDNQLFLLYNSLWEHIVPYLKKMNSLSHHSYLVPDIAAMLTTLSLKSCFSLSTRNRAVDLLTFFVSHDLVDVRLLCRYLAQISRSMHLNSLNNISITLIKGWLRCLLLLSGNNESEEDLSKFTAYIVTVPEMNTLFSEAQVTFCANSNYLEKFLIAVHIKYSSLQDFHLKNKFVNQIWSYFSSIERWLSHVVKAPKSVNLAMNIYHNVGLMFFKIPEILFTKSRPNSLLKSFLDLLLLPVQIQNPQYKLNMNVSEAIKSTLNLYLCGLFKLDPENDPYIFRCIKELLTVYVPRLVSPKGTILVHVGAQFSLLKCFHFSEHSELMSRTIIEILCNAFIKKQSKTPHQFAYPTLIFFNNLVRFYKNDSSVVKCFIINAFERICDVVMFCDDASPCKEEAKAIVHFVLDMHALRIEEDLGNDLMEIFNKLCHEHLAFTSRALFNVFEEFISVAPDLVARFLPRFLEKIKDVERKRGVGFDRSLRKGLERIEGALKNIRNYQETINIHEN